MKCNLDCSYCPKGTYGGHDNSTAHPPLADCLQTVDFMFDYVDLYMSRKPKGIRSVILNIYGGESLHYPDIVTVLEAVRKRHEAFKDSWKLTVTTTTNAIIAEKKFKKIIPLIDEFTCSYHSGNTDKQKQQFKNNLLLIKQHGVRQKCVVLMHPEPELFDDANQMIDWLKTNDIKFLPRQLDSSWEDILEFNYKKEQVVWFDKLYSEKSYQAQPKIVDSEEVNNMGDNGRACCGGRQLCQDGDFKTRHFFVNNRFPDWHCSVNHFFLYIKQLTGELFFNKDCKMNLNNEIGPIGSLSDVKKLLTTTQDQLTNNTMPVIQCKKSQCFCGLCAPKAKTLEDYNSMMRKYQT